jgi:serine/threonine protein kinase
MTLCINPRCDQPDNSDNAQFCQNCQSSLLLKQRYRATKVLGGGGFGKTYEATDQGVRNKVIKVLINNSPKAVELFQREAEVLSQLNHPGIPKVEPNSYIVFHPADGQAPVHCLVMEKVEGTNLRDYLKQLKHPIDSETAERWLKDLLLILQAVHERDILHRDIKPQNIILDPDGRLALIDFGAVREGTGTQVASSTTGGRTEAASHMAAGTTVTSVGYTAPEQMNGHPLRQSDFYSLGRTFVFLLTGKEPPAIDFDSYNDVLDWRKYAPDVKAELADLLDKMQSSQVRQRPEDIQSILQILEAKKSFSQNPYEQSSAQQAHKVESMSLLNYMLLRKQPIDSETAKLWLRGLTFNLQELHRRGILHGNIEPRNVVVNSDGKLALISSNPKRRLAHSSTRISTDDGYGGYTAPEQVNGDQASVQSDIYSLGRIFVFILTGQQPLEIPYDPYEDLLRWREYAPNVDPILASLIDCMQSTLARQRPQDTQSILDILEGRKNLPQNLSRQTYSQAKELNQSPRNSSLGSYHAPSQKVSAVSARTKLAGIMLPLIGLYCLYVGVSLLSYSSFGLVFLLMGAFFIFIALKVWEKLRKT